MVYLYEGFARINGSIALQLSDSVRQLSKISTVGCETCRARKSKVSEMIENPAKLKQPSSQTFVRLKRTTSSASSHSEDREYDSVSTIY